MITSFTGLLFWGITGALLVAAGWKKNRRITLAGAVIFFATPWLLGLFSALSLATVGLTAGLLFKQKLRPLLAGWLLVSGLMLYSSALGFQTMDLYALGYAPQAILIWAAVSLALAWQQGHRALACCWLLALALYPLGALESVNLWDAMLDPVAMVIAAISLACQLKSRLKK